MNIDHDIHVHTHLSACSHDPDATGLKMLRRAAEQGLKTIGFADHMWDATMPGASSWYEPQDLEHILQLKEEVADHGTGVRVLFGCETEYCGDGKVGISQETAGMLDFVLIPMSHFHMRGFVEPLGSWEAGDVARLLVKRFREVVGLGLATGIAHPLLPCGYGNVDEIIALISDEELQDCFGLAADQNVCLEITTCFFPSCEGISSEEFHDDTFLRVLSIAKDMGCLFHFASDTHNLEGIGNVKKLAPYLESLGLTRDDILPLAIQLSD